MGASLLKVREQLLTAATREPIEPPAALRATLRDYQRHGLTWLAELTSLGLGACLADDMGLGKTVTLIALHLHRREPAHAAGPRSWCARQSCSATGRRRSRGSRPASRYAASTAPARDPATDARPVDQGFVLTTYGTMRRDARRARPRCRGTWWSPTRRSTSRTPASSTARALRAIPSRGAGRPDRHAGGEQPHRALGDPRLGDPGPARQPQRLPQGVGRADRVGPRARPRRQFAELVGAVPAAPPQVRPRHRARAARQDRDRPPARADPRAGRPLRGVRPRHDGAHRARRRRDAAPRAGARAAHRPQADLQPPGPVPQAVRRRG